MRTAFVTGATGFLGYAIALELLRRGWAVRALSRSGDLPGELPQQGVTTVVGDLAAQERLADALRDCDVVFHVAADVNMWRRRWAESYSTNVEGTRRLAEAALAAGVRRFVYTSSGSTIGKPRRVSGRGPVVVDESSRYDFADLSMVYPHTKWLGEQVVLELGERGLEPVITHPTAIFGPGDWKGNLLPLFRAVRGRGALVAPRGWRTTCDVRDVAAAHVVAAERAAPGERFILGGECVTARDMLERIARAVAGHPPLATLPDAAFIGLGRAMDGLAALTERRPFVTTEMMLQATFKVCLSSKKAERELGYAPRPLDTSIADMVSWYRQHDRL